jgi:CHAT domain-containing protein
MKKTVLLIIVSAFIVFNCQLSAQTSDSTLKWKALMDSTNFYYDKNDNRITLKWAEKTEIEIVKVFGKMDTNYLHIIYILGRSYRLTGDNDKAELKFMELLEIGKKSKSISEHYKMMIYNDLGLIYNSKSEFTKSEYYLKEALAVSKELYGVKHAFYGQQLYHLSDFYRIMGKNDKAIPLTKEAIEIFKNTLGEKHAYYPISLNTLATELMSDGLYVEAEKYLNEAIIIAKETDLHNNIHFAVILSNLGGIYCYYKKNNEAIVLYEDALNLMEKTIGLENDNYYAVLNNLATVYKEVRTFEEAEQLYVKALNKLKEKSGIKNKTYLTVYSNLAVLYSENKRDEEAIKIRKEVLFGQKELLGDKHPSYLNTLNNLAASYNNLERYNEALDILLEVTNTFKKNYDKNNQKFSFYLIHLANTYVFLKKYNEAEQVYSQAYEIYNYLIDYIFPSLSDKEKENYWSNMYSEFEYYYFFVYEAYQNKKIDNIITSQLYNNIIHTKAILLSSSIKMRNRILNSNDSIIIGKFNDWKEKIDFISKLRALSKENIKKKGHNIDSLERVINDIEKDLSFSSKDFNSGMENINSNWKDIQAKLSTDEAAIEIISFHYKNKKFTDTIRYAALILKKDSPAPDLVLLTNGNDLEDKHFAKNSKMIKDLGEEYKNGSKMWTDIYINDLLKDMYVNFWQKIQEKLVGIKTVYLSVDGVYNKINLNTLVNPETGKYLAEEIDLRIVTSTRDLVNRNMIAGNNQFGNKTAELFGSPKFNLDSNEIKDIAQKYAANKGNFENNSSNNKLRGSSDTALRGLGYDELPGTKIEIEKISEILKSIGWTAKTHTGKDASEEAVKSVNSPKILHIATHGQFDKNNEYSEEQKKIYENPLFKSKLILAGGENTRLKLKNDESIDSGTEDGYLTAYEVMNMNLDNTELVVLSACETGLGEIRNGEGVYGLQRAFQVAGAKSLIMSLWKVPDAPTQELMLSFYSKWLGGMDKREAFRQSQMELAKKYPNFFYWGAFEIITNY